ncbi:MAG: hypothetical protein J0H76_05230 [Sphingobacteriales bacterium]|nr:hypothetical protein [Sphingobacteriales bacterium]
MAELTLESLADEIKALKEQNAKMAEENGALQKKVADLTAAQIEDKPEEPLSVPTELLEHKGETYKFAAAGYRTHTADGETFISAAELQADEKLVAELLKIKGQGILIKQA